MFVDPEGFAGAEGNWPFATGEDTSDRVKLFTVIFKTAEDFTVTIGSVPPGFANESEDRLSSVMLQA